MNGRSLRVLLAGLLVLGFSVLVSGSVAAANFSTEDGSLTINATSSNYPITINITNSDSSANITKVNITLYSFTFVGGTNSTTASNNNFSNSSTELGWVNATPAGFIQNGTSQNFTFNVNVPATAGSYNITVNITDTAGAQNSTNITYSVVDLPNYLITFGNMSNMSLSTNLIQNLSYVINITNSGNLQEMYNLSVVNCSNISQAGVGILNYSSSLAITLNAGETKAVQLNVSNSTSGFYSSCIMAKHYNGTVDTSNVTSAQNGVILNSSFYPDLTVPAVYWTSTGGQNPFAGGNITVNATLNNSGQFNFSGSLAVYLLWDGVLKDNLTVPNTSLGNGTPYNVSFSNITGILDGFRNLTVHVDALGNVTESNESNNFNTTQILVGYNVTILSVAGQSGNNAGTNRNVNITVLVKYPNGTVVTTLSKYNFTVYDMYGGSADATWTQANSLFDSTFNLSMNTSGIYMFNITSYSVISGDPHPGIHNLTIGVSRNDSVNLYGGNSSGNDYYYLVAPRFAVAITPQYYSKNELENQTVTINVTNTGNDTINSTAIAISVDTVDVLQYPSAATSCTGSSNITTSSYYACTISVKGNDITDNTDVVISATVTGNFTYYGVITTYTMTGSCLPITILNVAGESTTTPGGGDTGRKCTTDASCRYDEICSAAKKCTAISCPGGQIANHVCTPAADNISITDYTSSLSSVPGGANSTKVTIKNIGVTNFSAKLEVTISNVTATVSPASYSLGPGESYQFTVNFTVPNSTTIGNFSGSYKAYVATSTTTYDRKSFTFVVFPKEETKAEINVSYQNLSAAFSLLISELNQIKASGRLNQSALSALEELVKAANSTLLQMKAALDSSDYVSAQSLISQLNASINNAQSGMNNALAGSQGLVFDQGIWFWIAIVVIIVFVLGFFLYMFYPSKPGHQGYHPERGFVHPEVAGKEGVGARIKKKFRRKKREKVPQTTTTDFARGMTAASDEGHYETFHYSEGYRKEKPYGYEYRDGGVKGFFQRLRRKKSKKGPQMHIDQFAGQPLAQ